jgi:hypothetical protein
MRPLPLLLALLARLRTEYERIGVLAKETGLRVE